MTTATFSAHVTHYEMAESGKDKASRGLMFVCYGTSLEEQFEFVQKDWSNNPSCVPGERNAPNGIDKVTGILEEGSTGRPDARIQVADGEGTVSMKRFVHTAGAAYALTPSISTLRRLAAHQSLHENG
jgi:hypothetical protein